MAARVIDVLRRFLPAYQQSGRPLHEAQRRAVWAIHHCRTAAMGGHLHVCRKCRRVAFAYHSCNHRACPQCGRAATAQWVARELDKRIAVPYFMVTFTLPAELRGLFFGDQAKLAYDTLFAASSGALSRTLAAPRWLGAQRCGFTGILHTWNQRLHFHPHIHYITAGGGLDAQGGFVRVKNANFLVPVAVLARAFRARMREQLEATGLGVDPAVWNKDWGVHIQPFGDGTRAIQYLGGYVCRTAIGDARIESMGDRRVSFRWKDRAHGGRVESENICGVEFVARYLRHVLPRGLRSIRYFGFCHPAAKATRLRLAFLSGRTLFTGPVPQPLPSAPAATPSCPCCHQPMAPLCRIQPSWSRGPPPPTACPS